MSVKVRDLDYVNPRHKLPSCALPPEVRANLGLVPSVEADEFVEAAAAIEKSGTDSTWLATALLPLAERSLQLKEVLDKHAWLGGRFAVDPDREQLLEDLRSRRRRVRMLSGRPLRKSCSEFNRVCGGGLSERFARGGQSEEVYIGAANVSAVTSGAAGAGSEWSNPYGHAFVRRGTAAQRLASLQERAKDKRQMTSMSVCRSRLL